MSMAGKDFPVAAPQSDEVQTYSEWSQSVTDCLSTLYAEISQLKFLLSQALMIDAPHDAWTAGRSVTKFAYAHPKTLARLGANLRSGAAYVVFAPSVTKWIPTSLMPEERVIYTPNALPGIEKRLGKKQ